MFRHTIAVLQCDVVMFNSNVAVLCVHASYSSFSKRVFNIKDLGVIVLPLCTMKRENGPEAIKLQDSGLKTTSCLLKNKRSIDRIGLEIKLV